MDTPTPQRTRLFVVFTLLAVALIGLPAVATAQTSDDVEREQRELERARSAAARALEELRAANAALEDAVVEMNEINGELATLTSKTTQLRTRTNEYRAESEDLRSRAQDLVRQAYIGGRGDVIGASLEASSIQDAVTRRVILDQATSVDLVSITRLETVSREMDRLRADLSADLDRVAELSALSDLIVRRMETARERADQAYAKAQDVAADQLDDFREAERQKRIRDEEERQKRNKDDGAGGGLPPTATPGWQCPVPNGRFINDWGFPRSGGRTHKGTDIFAPRGSPAVAVSSGTVTFDVYSLGGKIVWLRGDDGNQYYYAHNEGFPSGLSNGDRVAKGQTIAFVGNTGNAITTSPHVHFQFHPGGGSAVNPYPTLAANC